MASPQLENGYAQISNEILEAFAKVSSLGSESFQVLALVLRYTYGFHRKEAEMSINFIANGTGIKRNNVIRATKRLVSKRILLHDKSSMIFNKNYDEWLVSKRIPSIQTDTGGVSKRIPLLVSKRIPKKDRLKIRTKDINTVATEVTTGHDEINPILEMFQMKINPTINYGNKTQRQAVTDLLALMGFEKLTRTIDYVVSIRSEAFAPTITTPYQLKEKLAQLINYQQKQSSKSALIASI